MSRNLFQKNIADFIPKCFCHEINPLPTKHNLYATERPWSKVLDTTLLDRGPTLLQPISASLTNTTRMTTFTPSVTMGLSTSLAIPWTSSPWTRARPREASICDKHMILS
uniref:Uncharacterized protein n=1 Tax=Cacopsylla melanoneura TaxID=428564 RepID=A0A8D9DY43_9HEMI